ncbi:hypothetical protein Tco_1025133 [Tanacetum coccineum]
MTILKFADTHNLVMFFARPVESEGFEQIVDFINAHTIKYVLTVNPTIYTSSTEQFWANVKAKTINEEVQLKALVAGKKIIVTEASIRSDLQLNDEEDEAVNEEMDDNLERAATTATGLNAEHDRGNINKTQLKATPNELSSLGTSSGGGPRHQETMGDTIAKTRSENVSKFSNDPLLVRENKDCSSLGDYKFKTESQEVREERRDKNSQAQNIIQGVSDKDVNLSVDEVTLAQALVVLKSAKVKDKANVIEEPSESITTTPTLTTTTTAIINTATSTGPMAKGLEKIQDKGKAKMIEPEPVKKLSKKDQLKLDEEVAQRLQAEFDEQERTELVEGSSKKANRAELKSLMEVIPDEEEVAVDAIPLATKPPSIIDWKIHKEGKKSYYQIIRADGSLNIPVEDLDLVLNGDLKTMSDPHVEDQVWKTQSAYRVLEWKLYDSCRVHSLRKQNVHIYMLVEKRYPITTPTITDMLNKKLKDDHWNEMCYQGRIIGIKRLLDDLRVTADKVCVTTTSIKLVLFINFKEKYAK